MSDKNIDKDIKRLKKLKDKPFIIMKNYHGELSFRLKKEDKQAITNILKELETWIKIAEFLAKNSVVRAKCERCVEDLNEDGCIRCMLNWAKSEVLKDE